MIQDVLCGQILESKPTPMETVFEFYLSISLNEDT